jgi:hypothetical protein
MEQEKQNLDTKEDVEVSTFEVIGGLMFIAVAVIFAVSFVWNIFTGEDDVSTPTQPVASRCLSVPDWITTRLNDGLKINGGGSITNLKAVKSKDFESVYFISGQLQGAGLGRGTDIATFVSNKIGANETGMTFSVGAVASDFSDWPDISTTNLGVSIINDGYSESQKCVSNS